ncbi:unnamed protein product [Miscanthus lutarioriparius]|uniref:Uncharacterized protein n=1 Tax=Miscanthus lutarioriparius TaxID=422564 RepID=A0A811QSM9_9POAL|nr:unnamed protein product [Miscanthus lutarioriparius]
MEFAAVTTASEVVVRGDAEGQRGCCGPAERRPEQRTTARGRREPRRGSTAGPRGSNRQRRPGTAAETVVEQAHEGDGAWKPQAGADPRTAGVLARGMAQPWRAAACRGGVGLRWCDCGRTATDEQCALAGKEEGGARAVARARRSLNGGAKGRAGGMALLAQAGKG